MQRTRLNIIKSRIGLGLLIPYLIISLLILILMLSLIYFNFRTQIDSTEKIQEEISLKASSEINFYISSIIEESTLISRSIHCINCDVAHNKEMIKTLVEINPSIYELAIVDSFGKEVDKIVRYDPTASEVLKEVAYEDKFIEAYKGEQYIGEYYMSDYHIPFLPISFPIMDEDDNIIGVLSAEIDLSPMWNTISKIKVKRTGYVYVVDHIGDLMAYKDINLIKENVNLGDIPIVKEALGEKGEKSEKYVSFTNEKVMGKWNSIDITNWAVIVELPMKEVYKEMIPLFVTAGLSILLLIVFILIMLVIILKRVLRPIGYLQEGVSEIKAGNLEHPISFVSKDEFGDLAVTFNEMTKQLDASKKKLEDYSKNLEIKIKERTKELEQKNKQLEKFTKFAVGREKRIVELKNQLKKAGVKPPVEKVSDTKPAVDKAKSLGVGSQEGAVEEREKVATPTEKAEVKKNNLEEKPKGKMKK